LARSKKKARRQRAWVFFQDESGVSQRPSVHRTWAPKGKTPALIHAFNWSKISICAAPGYRWDGRRSRLCFQTREGSYNTNSLIGFLKDLKRRLRGQKVILIWVRVRPRPEQDQLDKQEEARQHHGFFYLKCMDQPRFVNGTPLLIAGAREHYTPETVADIPAQWKRFAPHIGNIPGQGGHTTYGVCCNFDDNGGFDYICGVEVSDFSELPHHELPQQWDRLRILEQKYAVFTHSGHISTIKNTWDAIYRDWLPQSGRTPTAGPAFERYDESFNPATGMGGLEIWIPIRRAD